MPPTVTSDWRDSLCAELARIADEAQPPVQRQDRKFILAALYKLAEEEKNRPESKRIGALRAVEEYKQQGISQIVTKTIKLRKVVIPTYIQDEIAQAIDGDANGTDNSASSNNSRTTLEKPAAQVVEPISLALILPDGPVECVYGMLLDNEYPVEGVLPLIRDYLVQMYKAPEIAIVEQCVRAGPRYDILVRQNVDNFPVLRTLKTISWVRDVISKPPTMFGEMVIAAD